MKPSIIIASIAGAAVFSIIVSVVLSVNFITLSPKQLAKTVKSNPKVFY